MNKTMKGITFMAMLFFLATLIYFTFTLSFDEPLLDSVNSNNWLGIGASACGFLVALIIKSYNDAKENLEKKDN